MWHPLDTFLGQIKVDISSFGIGKQKGTWIGIDRFVLMGK
jgi:hypothetical protein